MKPVLTVLVAIVLVIAIGGSLWLWTPDKSRAELEAKYLVSPADLIEVAGVQLHVRDSGRKDAPAIVLLHGFGSSLHTWEDWARDLAADYRIVRYDQPGAGLSQPDPSGDYTIARSVAILTALMDRLGISSATLIGNSVGGKIAWNVAARYPERVSKLVLISPDGFASPGIAYGQKPDVPAMVKMMRYALPKSMLKMNIAPAYADPSKLAEATLDRYHDLMLTPGGRDAMIAQMEQAVLADPAPLLKRVQAPTLLLWGQEDAMIPFSNAADYARYLPHHAVEALAGLGHVPQEEAPAASLVPVRTFLAH